ncbi:MAG TPA: TetR/AcrR family transcriptional regulator, partial [Terriglobales bacterium]|nr:TetR/AcrR family transcriptional regulator [Terriglobales bacterium]
MAEITIPVEPLIPAASSHDRILAAAKRLFASQGYEATSTMAIARFAGTSESQMMKHFGSKEGLLEAILDQGWKSMSGELKGIESMPADASKLMAMLGIVLQTLNGDPDLKELYLLEGRRIRREGRHVVLSPGYIAFVRTVEDVLKQMAEAGILKPGVAPDAVRSAIMGMTEGMLRDQVLSRRRGELAAEYSDEDCKRLFAACLQGVTVKPISGPARSRKVKAKPRATAKRR